MKNPKMKRDKFIGIDWFDRDRYTEARARVDEWTDKREQADQLEQATLDELTDAIGKRTSKDRLQALARAYRFARSAAQDTRRTERAWRVNLIALLDWNDRVAGDTQEKQKKSPFKDNGDHVRIKRNKQGQTVDICKDDYIRLRQTPQKREAAGIVAKKYDFTTGQVRERARNKWCSD